MKGALTGRASLNSRVNAARRAAGLRCFSVSQLNKMDSATIRMRIREALQIKGRSAGELFERGAT